MKKTAKIFFIYSGFIFFIACTSIEKKAEVPEAPILTSTSKYFQWEAKALIKNTDTGEANILNLDIVGQKPFPIRIEANTSLGIHLASILILEKEVQFLLPNSKKFYSGPMSAKSLAPILNVALDPRLIVAALFDESFPDWSCEAQEGKIVRCDTLNKDKIEWFREKEDPGKRVEIKGVNYESQFRFEDQKEISSIKESAFVLKVPKNYRKYHLKD